MEQQKLSVAGVFKWILVIFGGAFLWVGYDHLIEPISAQGRYNLQSPAAGFAVWFGLGLLCLAGAGAIWFFFERDKT